MRNGDLPPGVAFVNRRSSEKLFAMGRWTVWRLRPSSRRRCRPSRRRLAELMRDARRHARRASSRPPSMSRTARSSSCLLARPRDARFLPRDGRRPAWRRADAEGRRRARLARRRRPRTWL